MKKKLFFFLCFLSITFIVNAQTVWNFTSDLEGWHDLGAGRDVTASWESGALKMTYLDGGSAGTQLWFAAIQVDNLSFDAANNRYLELNYQANNWPTSSPVKMLITLTKTDNSIVYSYIDIDPTKNFLSIDIQANNPGWGQTYSGTIKSIQLELPHNGAAASNPATNWYSASTLIDKIKVTNTQTPQDIVWDFASTIEGWNPYGDDVTTSHSGSNLVVTYTGGGDGVYAYPTIYKDFSIDAANIDQFYMKFTAHNWVKTSVLVNIVFEIGGTPYYANQTMTVANGEFTFDIRDGVLANWNRLPTTGTISRIRIEIPHSSQSGTPSDWNGATLDIDRIVFSKKQIPDPPTNIVATAGNTQASVAFTAPVSNGGSTILDYTVTSSPGGFTQTGASSPLVVTGLSNGTAYTFTVTARNSVGSSAASSVSNSVTPAPATVSVSSNTNLSSYFPSSATDVTVSSGELTVDANVTLKSLTVNPGAKVTLASGKTLTIVGAFILHSDATSNATFVDNGGTVTAGSINVEQYLTSGRNWYVASPVSGATSNVLSATAENPVYWYDEAHGSTAPWPAISNTSTSLNVMQGYVANLASTGVVTFSGNLNTGAKEILVTRTAGQTKEGFNLVGNPYPSYLNWTNVSKTNLSTTMWYRTKTTPAPVTGATTWVFDTYNATGGVGTSLGAKAVTNLIPPMQSFWVRVDAGQTSGTLSVTNSQRAHADNGSNGFKSKSGTATTQPLVRLEVSNGLTSDQALVYFNAAASNSFDNYDSPKMSNATASIPEIYTLAGSEQVTINGVNDLTQLALGFTTGEANNFTIKASQFTNFVSGTQIVLRDNVLNTEQDLTVADYNFYSDVTANNESRFTLLFKAPSVATGINQNTTDNVWISTNSNGQIVINGVNGETTVAVYNSVGQKLLTKTLKSTSSVLFNPLTNGVYMVTVINAGKTVTKKVIID